MDSQFRAIPAIIDGDQKAVQGSVIKLKLLDSIIVAGQVIPKGHNIYGLGSFSNQRLNLEIKNIRMGNLIVPVNLTVFDQQDAMIGINAPEAVLTDAVNNGVVNAAGSVSLPGFDLTTQLAGAGIDAARSLLSKKLKRIKQPLKSGYPLLLRDNTRKPIK
nr:conjugative transposon protein TraM [Pedobacter sp. SYSU D00382]